VVKISGSGFSTDPNGNIVKFNLQTAEVKSASANLLEVVVPLGAGTGPVSVQVGNKYTENQSFKFVSTYEVSTLAGNGTPGFSDGNSVSAQFKNPYGIVLADNGTLYIADGGNNRIRKITPQGLVSTIAGNGTAGFTDGIGTSAMFNNPTGLALDGKGNIFVADRGNHRIRMISSAGIVSTFAGTGSPGFANGDGSTAQFNNPTGIASAIQTYGTTLYIADAGNHMIRKISSNGVVSTIGGNGTPGFADGAGTNSRYNNPTGLAISYNGIYVADAGNNRIRKISEFSNPEYPSVTISGNGQTGFADGPGVAAQFNEPTGIAVWGTFIYITDRGNNRIRRINAEGIVSTLAGDGSAGYAEGNGYSAKFDNPAGLVWDNNTIPPGVIPDPNRNNEPYYYYIADIENNRIRKISLK
jgi:sugar lactone lactonase YvrE